VDDLKSSNKETVDTLRTLMLEAFDRPYDSAQLLYEAASRLSHLQDNAHLLHDAAHKLSHLQDNTHLLHEAAQELGHLRDNTSLLLEATKQLGSLDDRIYMFRNTADAIPWHLIQSFAESSSNITSLASGPIYPDLDTPALDYTATRMERFIEELKELRTIQLKEIQSQTRWPPSPAGWAWIKRGFVAGLIVSAALAVTFIALTANGGT
jgi:hypothetical protein